MKKLKLAVYWFFFSFTLCGFINAQIYDPSFGQHCYETIDEQQGDSPYGSGGMDPIVLNYSQTNYTLGDFSSRNSYTTGNVFQVPIEGTNDEFFLIAYRNKVSDYDRIMLGDTAHDNPWRVINSEYGKGLYIYHIDGGYSWVPNTDNECADGLFNWQVSGTFTPDWGNQSLPKIVKTSVSYLNDNSVEGLTNKDDKSVWGGEFNWGGLGNCINI